MCIFAVPPASGAHQLKKQPWLHLLEKALVSPWTCMRCSAVESRCLYRILLPWKSAVEASEARGEIAPGLSSVLGSELQLQRIWEARRCPWTEQHTRECKPAPLLEMCILLLAETSSAKAEKKKLSLCVNRNFPQLQEPAEDTALSPALKAPSDFSGVYSCSTTVVAPSAGQQSSSLLFYPYPLEDFVSQTVCCCWSCSNNTPVQLYWREGRNKTTWQIGPIYHSSRNPRFS